MCAHLWSVCVSVLNVGAVTVMRVRLFVLHVSMVKECEGDGNDGVVVVSVWHENEGGTHGSAIA